MTATRALRTTFVVFAVAVVALAALLIVELVRGPAAAAGGTIGAGSSKNDPKGAARSAAMQDAKDAAAVLFSYDYRQLDKDLAAGRAWTTGSFTTDYDQVSVPAVKPLATKYQVVVKATVQGVSVVDESQPGTVKVLVFVDQLVKNSQLSAPRLDADRTVLTMQQVGNGWKVAGVDAI